MMPYSMIRVAVSIGLLTLCFNSSLGDQSPQVNKDEKEEAAIVLKEVIVTVRPIQEELLIQRLGDKVSVITDKQIEVLNAHDVATALRRIPGVTISRYNVVGAFGGDAGGSVYIRGHGSGRPGGEISMMIDDIPRFSGVWAHPFLDLISVNSAERIHVYKSPQAVLLGNMSFGGLNILPRKRNEKGVEGRLRTTYGSYDTFTLQGEVTGKSEHLNYTLGGSRQESDGHRKSADGRVESIHARLGYQINEKWELAMLFHHSYSYAHDPQSIFSPPLPIVESYITDSQFYVLSLTHEDEVFKGYVKLYLDDGMTSWYQWHQPPPPPNTPQSFNNVTRFKNYGFRAREKISFTNDTELTFGFDLDFYGGEVEDTFSEGTVLFMENMTFKNIAPYLVLSRTFGNSTQLTPSAGIRYNKSRYFEEDWGAQAGLVAEFKNTKLYANWNRAFNLAGVYSSVFAARWGLGEKWKELGAEIVNHFEIGVSRQLNDAWWIDLSFFNDETKNSIRFDPPPPPIFITNVGDYIIKGIEYNIYYSPTNRWNIFLGGTYNESKPEDVPNLPKWTFSAGLAYKPHERWDLNFDAQYVGKQYILNPRFNPNQVSIEEFLLLNGRLAYNFTTPENVWKGTVYIAVENIADEAYDYRPGYPMPGRGVTVGMDIKF